jgi:hypothetical protein
MNKEILLQLIQQKDKKRKKMLCKFYQNYILMDASLVFIAQMINKDLGIEDIITLHDVKYCRWLLSKENIQSTQLPDIPIQTFNAEPKMASNPFEIKWTDPDDEAYIKTKNIKSKFS